MKDEINNYFFKERINVLSLFNGMGTLRQAMYNLNIKVDKYYSSEIKPYANQLQQYHFPDVIQVGDINNWKEWDIDWAKIDFIGSGSPCQDLSIAGNRAGLNGSRSSLFWVFIDILNHVKKLNPDVLFLQENVCSASKKDVGIMSRALGVYPVKINSKLVTAQKRCRYYWTNMRTKKTLFDVVTDIPHPKDRSILLKNIIESGEVDSDKSTALLEKNARALHFTDDVKFQRYAKKRQTSVPGMVTFVREGDKLRLFTQTELERLQGFPDGYTSILSYNKAASLLGDGWTLPVIEHILSFL